MCDRETVLRIRAVWITLGLGILIHTIVLTQWGTNLRADVNLLNQANSKGERFTWDDGADLRRDMDRFVLQHRQTNANLIKINEKLNEILLASKTHRHPPIP